MTSLDSPRYVTIRILSFIIFGVLSALIIGRLTSVRESKVHPDDHTSRTIDHSESGVKILDLVFVLDCTGSMGSYIASARSNIERIVTEVKQTQNVDVRFSLVRYRDFEDARTSYVVSAEPFTSDMNAIISYLHKTNADGGGDAPEAAASGLYAASKLDFRPKSVRVLVWIADAPPHGLDKSFDSHPRGDPDCPDILAVVEELAQKHVIIYSVGVEPLVGNYPLLRGFMRGVARRTGGRYVPLGNAPLLASVITGGAKEEIDLERVAQTVEEEVSNAKTEWPDRAHDDGFIYLQASLRLKERGVKVGHNNIESVPSADADDEDESSEVVGHAFARSASLEAAFASIPEAARESSRVESRAGSVGSARSFGSIGTTRVMFSASEPTSSYAEQSASYEEDFISVEQIERLKLRKS